MVSIKTLRFNTSVENFTFASVKRLKWSGQNAYPFFKLETHLSVRAENENYPLIDGRKDVGQHGINNGFSTLHVIPEVINDSPGGSANSTPDMQDRETDRGTELFAQRQ